MTMMHSYKVTLRVRNEIGVLTRITTLLRKFRVNIRSLDSAPVPDDERFSEIHMIVENEKDNHSIEIVMKKIERLIPVVSVLIC